MHRQAPSGFSAAVIVTALLLLGGGAAYRVAARQYARAAESAHLPPGTLARLPPDLEDWRGRDVPLDEAVIRATDTDQHLNRQYARRGGLEEVSFFIAYGVRLRDLMPHRPEVCYPGFGWTLASSQDIDIPLEDGSTLACRILHFERGGLASQRVTVLNYYVVDGEYSPDVELLRSKSVAWRPADRATYVAQIQVARGGSNLQGSTEESVREFATASALPIRALLPNAALPPEREQETE